MVNVLVMLRPSLDVIANGVGFSNLVVESLDPHLDH